MKRSGINWKRLRRLITWSSMLVALAIICFLFSVFMLEIPIFKDELIADQIANSELVISFRGVLINLTSTLIAAATSVLLYRVFLMPDEEESMEIERRARAKEQDRIQQMQGIETCLPEINTDLLEMELKHGDVYIVNTFLNDRVLGKIMDSFRRKLELGNIVKIALIHPDSKVVSARAAGSRYEKSTIQSLISENIEAMRRLHFDLASQPAAQARLEVHFYDRLPMAAYLFPTHVQISFFLMNSGTSGSPQCIFNLKQNVGAVFRENVMAFFLAGASPWKIDLGSTYAAERARIKRLLN